MEIDEIDSAGSQRRTVCGAPKEMQEVFSPSCCGTLRLSTSDPYCCEQAKSPLVAGARVSARTTSTVAPVQTATATQPRLTRDLQFVVVHRTTPSCRGVLPSENSSSFQHPESDGVLTSVASRPNWPSGVLNETFKMFASECSG